MLLQVENLAVTLRSGSHSVQAVDGVSFSVARGETFCLVGESGSGKSITALSIMRLLPRDALQSVSGRILFQGSCMDARQDLLQADESQMQQIRGGRIAMIFQEPMTSLNPVFTIGEQILETLYLHFPELDPDEARARVLQALRDVQLPEPELRMHSYPHQLSGGQRQRVMIAMAMVC
ncbi:MAG: ABC transporter ATP-binding protein, partial [Gammaproteobacteria bacterium]